MLKDLVSVESGFQTSVNIAFDLNNDDKIRTFIPTESSIDIIEQIFLSTAVTSTQRARILIGAYGRGKSHIILVLLSLLYKKDRSLFTRLLSKIQEYNPDLYDYIDNYLSSESRILPIIVNGSGASLTQSFLNALQISLNNAGLNKIMPDTHFEAAVNCINNWKDNYPETYEKLKSRISIGIEKLILSLKEYDVTAYKEFEAIYPDLTSGSEFNPFLGFDVVELYEKIAIKLNEHGYCGIYVIYDEFSKYLESSISSATLSDIKLLQDFAEKCNRSGAVQMHLMLICHKDIANYIDSNLPKEKVDGWRGVSGRFLHMNLHNNYAQMYEIISTVIRKNPDEWESYCGQNEAVFDSLKDRYISNGLIADAQNADLCIKGCYPLHPVSTFILPRISEKIAQNERTLFTFLSAEEKNTLNEFIKANTSDFPLLTPEKIYDYFESLLRSEPYTSEIHQLYKLSSVILKKISENTLEQKIIKTITLIYAIEQFEKLAPTYDTIVNIFRDTELNEDIIGNALNNLIKNECLVYLKRSNGYLKLKESSGVDIPAEIEKTVETIKSKVKLSDILNSFNNDNYLYPNRYNDNYEMIRYFDFLFITGNEYINEKNWKARLDSTQADGIVFAIIPESLENLEIIEKSISKQEYGNSRLVFILPKVFRSIEETAYEIKAVQMLKIQAEDDDLLADEYGIYLDDLEEIIAGFISDYVRPEKNMASYYHQGNEYKLTRKAQLSSLLSQICELTYSRTPIINNESINKKELSTVAINSRAKIISGLLASELLPNLGLTGTGQDVSIMRSVLLRTGIINNIQEEPKINLAPEDKNLKYTLDIIKDFIENSTSDNEGEFYELYRMLTGPDYKIGLRLGVIPLLLSTVFHEYKSQLIIKRNGIEEKITANLINDINNNPKQFTVFCDKSDDNKNHFIISLEDLFAEYTSEKERSINRYAFLTQAMNRWYLDLPKYSKELQKDFNQETGTFEDLDKSAKKFIRDIKKAIINPRDYIYEGLAETFDSKPCSNELIEKIRTVKSIYDRALGSLVKSLCNTSKSLFTSAQEETFSRASKKWALSLKESTKTHLFSGNENQIIELFESGNDKDEPLIRAAGRLITSLKIEDWTETTKAFFIERLKTVVDTVNAFDKTEAQNGIGANSYKIVFVDNSGNEHERSFQKTEYSKRAKLLFNEVQTAVDEMGQSISDQEKRQVLVEILEKLC